jgi:hypothetical protein
VVVVAARTRTPPRRRRRRLGGADGAAKSGESKRLTAMDDTGGVDEHWRIGGWLRLERV